MIEVLLKNVCIQEQVQLTNVAVDGGRIIDVGPELEYSARQEFDLNGRLLIPGFVESHLHLDIALMNSWGKAGRPLPFRVPADVAGDLTRRRAAFTQEDIERRASAALELASRHGITALRAQCHIDPEVKLRHLEALLRVKQKYAGRVAVQIVAFPTRGLVRHPEVVELFREAFRMGADVMGCASRQTDLPGNIDAAFALAIEHNVDLDVHADVSLEYPPVELDDMDVFRLAQLTLKHGFQGRVAAGHLCTLGSCHPEVADKAIALILQAGISVVSLPDLYRLGRQDTCNVRRGLTRVKELLRAGVNVTYASNNVRDAIRPLGNCDLLEEALILSYGAHMDTVEELETLIRMSTYNAAKALRLDDYGVAKGCAADLVVLDASSASSAVASQAEKLLVFKAGRLVAASGVSGLAFNTARLEQLWNRY